MGSGVCTYAVHTGSCAGYWSEPEVAIDKDVHQSSRNTDLLCRQYLLPLAVGRLFVQLDITLTCHALCLQRSPISDRL